jgi:hypothetical protein
MQPPVTAYAITLSATQPKMFPQSGELPYTQTNKRKIKNVAQAQVDNSKHTQQAKKKRKKHANEGSYLKHFVAQQIKRTWLLRNAKSYISLITVFFKFCKECVELGFAYV